MSPQETITPLPAANFQRNFVHMQQGYLTFVGRTFENNRSDLMTDYIWEL